MGSSVSKVLILLYDPRKYFLEINGSSSLWGSFFLFLVLLLAASLFTLQADAAFEARNLEESGLDVSLSTIKALLAAAILLKVAHPFAAAGICWFLISLSYETRFDYKQILAIVLGGEIIYALGQALMAPITVVNDSGPVSISLTAIAPTLGWEQASVGFFLLSRVELFFLWEIAVVAIGLSTLTKRRTSGKIVTISAVSVGFVSLLSVLVWM